MINKFRGDNNSTVIRKGERVIMVHKFGYKLA